MIVFIRLFLLFPAVLLCSTLASAQTVKYFRHADYDGYHKYHFRIAVNDKDTATANCYRVQYDKSSRPIRWDYLKARHSAADPTFGFASVVISYEGKTEKHAFFDKLNRPTKSSSGDHSEKIKIESDKETAMLFQYDRIGKLLEKDENGCSRYLLVLDDEGRHTKQFCLNDIGIKIESNSQVFETRYRYNKEGRVSEISYFRQDGSPTGGIAKTTTEYDKRGNISENRHYGSNGEPYSDGEAQIKSSHNAQGYETKRETFNANGLLIKRSEYKYDRKGNLIEFRHYGADGELEGDMAHSTLTYDDANNLIHQATFDAHGDMIEFIKRSYDEKNRVVKVRVFNPDSTPRLINGYHIIVNTYDPDGKWEEEAYFDEKGESVYSSDGYASLRLVKNEFGDITGWAYYDTEQNLMHPRGQNAAVTTLEYSPGGKLINAQYFGSDGQPIDRSVTTTPPPGE